MKNSDQAIGYLSEGLVVGLASPPELVVVAAGARRRAEGTKAHRSPALATRRLRAKRAKTTRLCPEALVTGDEPA